jgi:hypothetical protein
MKEVQMEARAQQVAAAEFPSFTRKRRTKAITLIKERKE